MSSKLPMFQVEIKPYKESLLHESMICYAMTDLIFLKNEVVMNKTKTIRNIATEYEIVAEEISEVIDSCMKITDLLST